MLSAGWVAWCLMPPEMVWLSELGGAATPLLGIALIWMERERRRLADKLESNQEALLALTRESLVTMASATSAIDRLRDKLK